MADQTPDLKASKDEIDKKEAPEGKKGKKKLVLIAGVFAVVLVVLGAVLFLAPTLLPESLRIFGPKNSTKEAKETKPKKSGSILSIEPFVVNLADLETTRYLKVKMDIESQELVAKEEFDKNLPQLRDAILAILTSKTFKDIIDSEGKKKLKEEIILRANQLSTQYKMKTVYFTEFVIQ